MIPATVLLGSMAAGGLGLYLRGSTGPSELEKTVDDSVSAVTQQVSDATQQVSAATQQVTESVSDFVEPDDNPEPVALPQPVPAEPVEPVEPEQPVEQPVESVEQPMVKTPEQIARQAYLEDRDSMHPMQGQSLSAEEANELRELKKLQGGQRGGYGRPTWAPLNSGSSLMQALGVQPGSTAGNLLATATGSKTPQQIQQELVEVDRQLRSLNVKEFNLKQNQTEYEDINKDKVPGTNHTDAPDVNLEDDEKPEGWRLPGRELTFRQRYVEAYNRMFTSKTLLEDVTKEISKYSRDVEPQVKTVNLKEEALKLFPPLAGEKQKGKGMWSERAVKHFNTNSPPEFPDLKPRGDELTDKGGSGEKWYDRISKGSGSGGPDKNKLPNLLRTREKQTSIFQRAESDLEYFKDKYEENAESLKQVKLERQEVSKEIKELETKRTTLLEELSAYKVPTSFWDKNKLPEATKSILPTGEELNRLMARYKDIEQQIKEKQEEIDNYISNHLDDKNAFPLDDKRYVNLTGITRGAIVAENGKITMKNLTDERENIIAEIEGRSKGQKTKLQALNELDIFIKQLKEQKVKAVTLFDNPDFRKVFDMLTLMSLDSDAKSFVVNMDKYSNFFVTTKGFSAYNGEVLDKAFYFLNNYDKLIKDDTAKDYIKIFANAFKKKGGVVKRNIQQSKTFLENSGDTTTDEFKKLDATQRRILEGRSTAWHTFFTDSDRLKAIPKALSSVLFKTELDKLVKLESVIKRRILDKMDKTKFETVEPSTESWTSWILNKLPNWPTLWSSDSERVTYLKRLCEELKPVIKKELDSVMQSNKIRLEKVEKLKKQTEENAERAVELKRLKKAMDSSVDKTTSRYSKLLSMYNTAELKFQSEDKAIAILTKVISELPSEDEHIKELEEILKNLETDCVKWIPTYYDRARMGSRFQALFEGFLSSLGTRPIATYDEFRNLAGNYVISRVGRQFKNEKGELVKPQGTYTEEEFDELFKREVARLNLLVRYNICKFSKGQRVQINEAFSGKPIGSKGMIDQVIQCKAYDDSENKYTVLFDGDTTATEGVLQSILESISGPEPEQPLPPAVLSVDSFDKTGVTISWTGGSPLKNTLILTAKVSGISERAVTTSNPFTFKRSLADDTEFTVQLESELGTQKVTSNIVDFKTSKTAMNPIIAKLDDVTQNTITVSWTGGDGATITSEINGVANPAPITSPHTFTGLIPETDYSIVIVGTLGTDVIKSSPLIVRTLKNVPPPDSTGGIPDPSPETLSTFKEKINYILTGRIGACPKDDEELKFLYKSLKFVSDPNLLNTATFITKLKNDVGLTQEQMQKYLSGAGTGTLFKTCFHPDKIKPEFKLTIGKDITEKLQRIHEFIDRGYGPTKEPLGDTIVDKILAIVIPAPNPKNEQDNKYCVENDPPFVRIDECKIGADGYKVQTLDQYIIDHNLTDKVVTIGGKRYLQAYRTEKLKYANDNPLTRVEPYETRMKDFFVNRNERAISNSKRPDTPERWKRFGNEPSIGINLTTELDGALGYSFQLVEPGQSNFSLKTFFINIDETKNVLSIKKRCSWAQITCDQKANITYDLIVHQDVENKEINILDRGRKNIDKITSAKYILNPDDTKVKLEERTLFDKSEIAGAPPTNFIEGDIVKLIADPTKKDGCLSTGGKYRQRIGKITALIPDEKSATVVCYDKSRDGVTPVTYKSAGPPTKYLLTDLIKVSRDELTGYPPGSPFIGGNHETRRHRVRGMPKRAKTRRMY